MRVVLAILTVTFVAVGAGPSLAKTSEVPKTDGEASAPTAPCYSYEQAADGSWKQTPCEEPGLKLPSPSKVSSTRDAAKSTR